MSNFYEMGHVVQELHEYGQSELNTLKVMYWNLKAPDSNATWVETFMLFNDNVLFNIYVGDKRAASMLARREF